MTTICSISLILLLAVPAGQVAARLLRRLGAGRREDVGSLRARVFETGRPSTDCRTADRRHRHSSSAASLTVEREAFGRVISQVYALNGSESTNKSGAVTQVSRSSWVGRKLVTEGTKSQVTSQGFASWKFRETRSLDAAGAMVVEATHTGTDGVVTAATQVFVRVSKLGAAWVAPNGAPRSARSPSPVPVFVGRAPTGAVWSQDPRDCQL